MKNSSRTVDFLPEIFKTTPNRQFLQATLEPLTSKSVTSKIEGYVGKKFVSGVNASDRYVPPLTTERGNYQFEPSVVFTNNGDINDFMSYTGLVKALRSKGCAVRDHNKLFSNEFYAWDAFVDLDKLVNYNQYYWVPTGPETITVHSDEYLNLSTIIGSTAFTTSSGVQFTNGLKVVFSGNVHPSSKVGIEYIVEGVGEGIQLVPFSELIPPAQFTIADSIAYDAAPYGTGGFDASTAFATPKDYITINRASTDRNAWSRMNRWVHVDVLEYVAKRTGSAYSDALVQNQSARATRPIIEFKSNLRLMQHGTSATKPIDFFVSKESSNLINVQERSIIEIDGVWMAFDDVSEISVGDVAQFHTAIAGIISAHVGYTITEIDLLNSKVKLSQNGSVVDFGANQTTQIVATIGTLVSGNDISISGDLVGALTAYFDVDVAQPASKRFEAFDGARVVFENDATPKVYILRKILVEPGQPRVMTLAPVADEPINELTQINVSLGTIAGENSYYFQKNGWHIAQEKVQLNQPPLFDVFNENGVSFSDQDFYPSSTFVGSTLFQYAVGSGTDDTILGFPLKYSSVTNLGDITYNVTFNTDTFTYFDTPSVSVPINNGVALRGEAQLNGWVTAVAPSVQYQMVEMQFDGEPLRLDIAPLQNQPRPAIKVTGINGNKVDFSYMVTDNGCEVTPDVASGTAVQIAVHSDQVSELAYFEIPTNLSNNPFNDDVIAVNAGDIRQHYRSVCDNHPDFSGAFLGVNNYRDLTNPVAYATKIIQSSHPIPLLGLMAHNPSLDATAAIEHSASEYQRYKNVLLSVVQQQPLTNSTKTRELLDSVMTEIAATRDGSGPFYYSDMIPNGVPTESVYRFANNFTNASITVSRHYTDVADYHAILVYRRTLIDGFMRDTLLIKGVDYTISSIAAEITVKTVYSGDIIVVHEYASTVGSYVPSTPAKLGILPASVPKVVYDDGLVHPAWFIQGHDGSRNRLWGEFNDGIFSDFRDAVLYEFEVRIYNNIKVDCSTDISELIPGAFRTIDRDEWMVAYTQFFNAWVGKNKIDYQTQYFSVLEPRTWNYRGLIAKDGTTIASGNWKGLYQWYYDTTMPHLPWELIGYTTKPSWWDARYGAAPYTSDNLVMWEDLAAGIDYNDGAPKVIESRVRPYLLSILPVDSNGDALDMRDVLVPNYEPMHNFNHDWIVGDCSPVEMAYRTSSQFQFDLAKIFFLMQPAKFVSIFADADRYTRTAQYEVDGDHRRLTEIAVVYGTGTAPQHSHYVWAVDSLARDGIDAPEFINAVISNVGVNLVHQIGGFTDNSMLKMFVEKTSPNSKGKSLLIPEENCHIVLHSEATSPIEYSSVIVQRTASGYAVWGNSQHNPQFSYYQPKRPTRTTKLSIGKSSAEMPLTFGDKVYKVTYGTVFATVQQLVEFIAGYGQYLSSVGLQLVDTVEGQVVTWSTMITELLYWVQTGWDSGSTINLNPCARVIKIDTGNSVVQPIAGASVLNQNLVPIPITDVEISRDGTEFTVTTKRQSDSMSYAMFNTASIEHAVVVDNVTTFNDVIYNQTSGLRQSRLFLKGSKTAQWSGYVNANGFIMNSGSVAEWSAYQRYPMGTIVKRKNEYWTAKTTVQPSATFNQTEWAATEYANIKKGLLPNADTRINQLALAYDHTDANLQTDRGVLGSSSVGFRPRDYLIASDITDAAHVGVFSNMLKTKGTSQSMLAFNGARLVRGDISYNIHENWAIASGEFGNSTDNFIEFATPNIKHGSSYVLGEHPFGLSDVINYKRKPSLPLLPTHERPQSLFMTAGDVDVNDVAVFAYDFADLQKKLSETKLIVGDLVWLAVDGPSWGVYECVNAPQITQATNNFNGTFSLTFNAPHGLSATDKIVVSDMGEVNGAHVIQRIVTPKVALINLILAQSTRLIKGSGLVLTLKSKRYQSVSEYASVKSPSKIAWVGDTNAVTYTNTCNYTQTTTQALTARSMVSHDIYGLVVSSADQISRYTNPSDLSGATSYPMWDGVGDAMSLSSNGLLAVSTTTGAHIGVDVFHVSPLLSANYVSHIGRIDGTGIGGFGKSVALSDDGNWLYVVADTDVYGYKVQYSYTNITETTLVIDQYGSSFTVAGDQTGTFSINEPIAINSVHFYVISTEYDGTSTLVTVDRAFGFDAVIGTDVFEVDLNCDNQFQITTSASVVKTNHNGSTVYVGGPSASGGKGQLDIYERLNQRFHILPDATVYATASDFTDVTTVVTANGVTLESSEYSITSGTISFDPPLTTGTLIEIESSVVVKQQTVVLEDVGFTDVSQDARFGHAIDVTRNSIIMCSAPGQRTSDTNTGACVLLQDAGRLTGSTTLISPTVPVKLLVNGFLLSLAANETPAQIANKINTSYISNVTAQALTNSVMISLKTSVNIPSGKALSIVRADGELTEIHAPFVSTQILSGSPDDVFTEYGSSVSFDADSNAFIGASKQDTSVNTTFNDALFDDGSTTFATNVENAGAIQVFHAIADGIVYFSLAQTAIGTTQDSLVGDKIAVFDKAMINAGGQEIGVYNRSASLIFSEYPANQAVDFDKIGGVYEYVNNVISTQFDVVDHSQGKLLSAVMHNVDHFAEFDPADYNSWGSEHDGAIWADIKHLRLTGNDTWADGSTVDVCTWITSNIEPTTTHSVSSILNSAGLPVQMYHYWAVTGELAKGKTLSDTVIQQYIMNPMGSGVPYVTITPSAITFNNHESTDGASIVIKYGDPTKSANVEFDLIREGHESDFLDGMQPTISGTPSSLYSKFIDSIAGVSASGATVPDPYLPALVQYGVRNDPVQSMFIDRSSALREFVLAANKYLAAHPITELRTYELLMAETDGIQTSQFWEIMDWCEAGYENVVPELTLSSTHQFAAVSPHPNMIVNVCNSSNQLETWVYETEWRRIWLENGTIQLTKNLYDTRAYGFGTAFDSAYDIENGQAVRNIVRSVFEEIFIGDLSIYRNAILISMFKHIMAESGAYGRSLDWLNKTSLIDVEYTGGELTASDKYLTDNLDFIEGYINECKPYRVVIKDFLSKYAVTSSLQSTTTDFDLPAGVTTDGSYITPMLTENVIDANQFNAESAVWEQDTYRDWYANHGLKLRDNGLVEVGTVAKYIGFNDTEIYISNTFGIPASGVVSIDAEDMYYDTVGANGKLSGVVRGVNNTEIATHIGSTVFIKSDAVVILHGGRGYDTAPTVNFTSSTSPRTAAVAHAQIVNGAVTAVIVDNNGDGYSETVSVVIEPAFTGTITQALVESKQVWLSSTTPFNDGDIVEYVGQTVGAFVSGQRYYLGVNATLPATTGYRVAASLYRKASDVGVYDLRLPVQSPIIGGTLSVGAYGMVLMESGPVRHETDTDKYDRTSYRGQIKAWESGTHYLGLTDFGSLMASASETVDSVAGAASQIGGAVITAIGENISLTYDAPAIAYAINHQAVVVHAPLVEYPVTPVTNVGDGLSITVADLRFVDRISNTYTVAIIDDGAGYYNGQTIVITGDDLGGTSPANDAIITIVQTDGVGSVTAVEIVGKSTKLITNGFLVVNADSTVKLYSDASMTTRITPNVGDRVTISDVSNVAHSLVHHNHNVYECIVSNSSTQFIQDEWKKLDHSDVRINAMDRMNAYFSPGDNMRGAVIERWFDGATYPYAANVGRTFTSNAGDELVIKNNRFKILADIRGVCFTGSEYIAIAETASASIILTSTGNGQWDSYNISISPLNTTSITYNNGQFIVTADNAFIPALVSTDAATWVAASSGVGFAANPYDSDEYDSASVNLPAVPLLCGVSSTNEFIVAGKHIHTSTDGLNWSNLYSLPDSTTTTASGFHGVAAVTLSAISGFVACGVNGSSGIDIGVIYAVENGVVSEIHTSDSKTFTAIVQHGNRVIAFADDLSASYSSNGSTWVEVPIGGNVIKSAASNGTVLVAVGTAGVILRSIDGIAYTDVSVPNINLNTVAWANGSFVAMGDDGIMLFSSDGASWTSNDAATGHTVEYTLSGSEFDYGYAPEELVGGIVRESINIRTTTSSSGDFGGYQDTFDSNGYVVKTITVEPNVFARASFDGVCKYPFGVAVWVMSDGIGTRIYENITTDSTNPYTYTVDWKAKTIALNTDLPFGAVLRIDVYEVGGGNIICKSSSEYEPSRNVNGVTRVLLDVLPSQITPIEHCVMINGANVSYEIVYDNDDVYLEFDHVLSDDEYLVYAIMGQPSIEVQETTLDASLSVTCFGALGDNITTDNAVVYVKTQTNWVHVPETGFTVVGNAVTIDPIYATAGNETKITMLNHGELLNEQHIGDGSGEVTVSRQIAQQIDASGLSVRINGIGATNFSLSGTTLTVPSTAGDIIDVLIETYALPTTVVYEVNSVTDEFACPHGHIQVEVNGLQTTEYTRSVGYITLDSPVSSGVVAITGYKSNRHQQFTTTAKSVDIVEIDSINATGVVTTKTAHGFSSNDVAILAGLDGVAPISGVVSTLSATEFTLSTHGGFPIALDYRGGGVCVLSGAMTINHPGIIPIENPVRVSVSINGTRVNDVSIVDGQIIPSIAVAATDTVLLNTMTAHSVPDSVQYSDNGSVIYREKSSGWLLNDINADNAEIAVNSVEQVFSSKVQTAVVQLSGVVLTANIMGRSNQIAGIKVFNKRTRELVDTFTTHHANLAPYIEFTDGVELGDELDVRVYYGKTLRIDGEALTVSNVDPIANTINVIARGAELTPKMAHKQYTRVYGVSHLDQMPVHLYDQEFNSYKLSPLGDPLALSTTDGASFLMN